MTSPILPALTAPPCHGPAVCRAQGYPGDPATAVFLFDGSTLKGGASADDLDMEDSDMIDVRSK